MKKKTQEKNTPNIETYSFLKPAQSFPDVVTEKYFGLFTNQTGKLCRECMSSSKARQ